jgi:hypothetical protein
MKVILAIEVLKNPPLLITLIPKELNQKYEKKFFFFYLLNSILKLKNIIFKL